MAFARLAVAMLFLLGSNVLPLVHFTLCEHEVNAHGEVVHTGHGHGRGDCTKRSCPAAGLDWVASASPHAPNPVPASNPAGSDGCLVFQAIQQSFDSVQPQTTADLPLLAQGGRLQPTQLEQPVRFKLYLLAPSHSPPQTI